MLLGLGMVWCPFVGILGRGGGGFKGPRSSWAGAVVTGVLAKGVFNVPAEVLLADDFAGVKPDIVQGQLWKARCMDAARSWIIDERVALTVEDEEGFPPSLRQGERGNRCRSRLMIRSHSVPRSILGT